MSAVTQPEVAPENQHDGTVASDLDLKAGRRKVARSRGVLSGVLLLLLGAWAALAPFIGPYFKFGYEPRSGDAWHWTSGRGLYEVLPGGVTALAGLVLLFSASRVLTVLMSWLAALAGAWLVIAPVLSTRLTVGLGTPPTSANADKAVALQLLYFFATGAAIAVIAGIAIGRLSVHSVRDVRAAERRAEAEAAAEAQRQESERQEAQRLEAERLEAQRRDADRIDHDRVADGGLAHDRGTNNQFADDRFADGRADGRTDGRQAENDRRTAALPAVGDHDGVDRSPTTERRDDDRYAAPSAGPYEPTGNRDAAGSSSYSGHRSMGQHSAAPDAAPLDDTGYRTDNPSGAHAIDPSAPPPPGATEQYRYGTPQNPVPPEERER